MSINEIAPISPSKQSNASSKVNSEIRKTKNNADSFISEFKTLMDKKSKHNGNANQLNATQQNTQPKQETDSLIEQYRIRRFPAFGE